MEGLIDTHAHLNSPKFSNKIDIIYKRSKEAGISQILVVGYNLKNSQEAVRIAKQYPDILASVGLHPSDVGDGVGFQIEDYINLIQSDNKVIAIGEVGLDYYRAPNNKKEQIMVFQSFIRLAVELKLPLILHLRDSYEDAFKLLCQEKELPLLIFHCFSGGNREAKRALDLGGYISFAGNLTYPKAQDLRNTLRNIPLDRLLLETDAPYLPPQSKRGELCEPSFILETYELAAKIKSLSLKELVRNIKSNWIKIIGD